MGPTWGSSGADRTQVGPMLAPWTLLSGLVNSAYFFYWNGSFLSSHSPDISNLSPQFHNKNTGTYWMWFMYTEQLNNALGEFGSVFLKSKPNPFYLKMDLDLENIWSCLYWTTYKIKWYSNTNLSDKIWIKWSCLYWTHTKLSDNIWIKMPLILLNKYKKIMLHICITGPHLNIKMSNL